MVFKLCTAPTKIDFKKVTLTGFGKFFSVSYTVICIIKVDLKFLYTHIYVYVYKHTYI